MNGKVIYVDFSKRSVSKNLKFLRKTGIFGSIFTKIKRVFTSSQNNSKTISYIYPFKKSM